MKRLAILVGIIAALVVNSTAFAVQMRLTLIPYEGSTLEPFSKTVEVSDPNDQLEVSMIAADLAVSSEGWDLGAFGCVRDWRGPPKYTAELYFVGSPWVDGLGSDLSIALGYDLNDEALLYGPSFTLWFHTDAWVQRGGHDMCENVDNIQGQNYGVISAGMGGVWWQCAIPDWGTFALEVVPPPAVSGCINEPSFANAEVVLMLQGEKKQVTTADDNGCYEFYDVDAAQMKHLHIKVYKSSE
jgi:hypothetical protein